MQRIDTLQRRARLAARHRLGAPVDANVVAVARDLVALHATDAASVFLAVWARTAGVEPENVESALYGRRSLVRMLGMRRTMFVVPADLVNVVDAACSRAVAVKERRRLLQHIAAAGFTDQPENWLRDTEEATLAALAARGEALGAELTADVPRLRAQLFSDLPANVTTRILFQLAAEGRIVRGRPRGSWTSSQYRWAAADSWLPGGVVGWATEEARAELARRWLYAFGPAPLRDLQWWTGWTLGQTRSAVAAIATVEILLDDGPGLVLADDRDPVPVLGPWIALLPALDPTVMGWSARGWYLGGHGPALFDRTGNPGPTVWSDGRIVGGWAQRSTGEVVVRLLEDVGSEVAAAVHERAERLRGWLGAIRVTPRFRTPLERELVA